MSDRRHDWFIFGFYGLAVSDGGTLRPPLFGDAALASVETASAAGRPLDEKTIKWMIGLRPYRDHIGTKGVQFGEFLDQPPPNSFILVKRRVPLQEDKETTESAANRAREIAALLTVARSCYANDVAGFMDVTSLGRGPSCGVAPVARIGADYSAPLRADHRIYTARWLREPDQNSYEELRVALDEEGILLTKTARKWILTKDDAFVSCVISHKRSPIEQRIVRAAVNLYLAHHAATPEQRLAAATTSLEMLFDERTNFERLESRLCSLLGLTDESRDAINSLMRHRHAFVHEGEAVPEPAADAALGISSQAIISFAEGARRYPDIRTLTERLDLISAVRESTGTAAAEKSDLLTTLGMVAPKARARWIGLHSAT